MIELARHIEILLLENDCVIIPDFGGFIAHYQPARYIKEENLYLPPVRTIGFNPQLTINDGLLVQSYMQAHHTDFPDATRMIEEEVAGLKEQLYQNGCAEMHGIGSYIIIFIAHTSSIPMRTVHYHLPYTGLVRFPSTD